MSSPSKTYWSINSAVFPRNPDNWTKKHNASNVSYVTMADGTIRRIVVPYRINPAPVELEWHYADERLRTFVLSKLNQDLLYKVTVDGKLPARQIWMYFDTPEENMSKDIVDFRAGQGGMRSDLKITGMMDGPYQHSANVVPAGTGAGSINLIPDTNFTTTGKPATVACWGNTPNGGSGLKLVASAGPNSTNAFQLSTAGSGAAVGFDYIASAPINVTPGQWYVLSGFIDNTNVTAGSTFWGIYDTGISKEYKRVSLSATLTGRTVQAAWQCPAGVTQIRVICDANNATVSSGGTITFANPQLERGSNGSSSVASAYSANSSLASGYLSSDIASWFGGPTGNNAYDLLSAWDGNAWVYEVFQSAQTTVTPSFTNLGTAPWSPTILIRGPLNTGFTITAAYQDVDGTGQGVVFTYTGAALASGSYLLFDTQKMRVWSVTSSGAKNEIYTWTLTTVANSTPFPYWPPFPSGEFSISFSFAGADGSMHSGIDLSNNGTETFRYW